MLSFLALAMAVALLSHPPNPSAVPAPAPLPAAALAPAPLDTLVNVGGHRLHFQVWKGTGPVILFEAGGGDDLAVWNKVLAPLQQATGATLLAYDRAGFGKSGLDSTRMRLGQQVADLKTGLDRLRLGRRYVVVAHSFGGFFATLFAATYPNQVKGAVLVDASHVSYYTDARLQFFESQYGHMRATFKAAEPGKYWMLENATLDRDDMRKAPFPATIPVVDVLAEKPPTNSAQDLANWQQAHRQFVAAAPNRRLVTAAGSGHYVMADQPELVTQTIAQLYQSVRRRK